MRARLSSEACELSLTARNWGEPVCEHTTVARNYTGFAMFELHTCSSIKYKYVMIIHIYLSITCRCNSNLVSFDWGVLMQCEVELSRKRVELQSSACLLHIMCCSLFQVACKF
jgi:hypothetical protein